jgi:hypothetical protein
MDSGVKGASIALLSSRALTGWASSSPIDGPSTRPQSSTRLSKLNIPLDSVPDS